MLKRSEPRTSYSYQQKEYELPVKVEIYQLPIAREKQPADDFVFFVVPTK